jgi:hypothetical protein
MQWSWWLKSSAAMKAEAPYPQEVGARTRVEGSLPRRRTSERVRVVYFGVEIKSQAAFTEGDGSWRQVIGVPSSKKEPLIVIRSVGMEILLKRGAMAISCDSE